MLETKSINATQTNEYVKTDEFKVSTIKIEPKNMSNIKRVTTIINLPEKIRFKSNSPKKSNKILLNLDINADSLFKKTFINFTYDSFIDNNRSSSNMEIKEK